MSTHYKSGITLGELIIALGLLGMIAAMTLPKVLNAHRDRTYDTKAKEAMTAVHSAWHWYEIEKSVSVNTQMNDLVPYLNHVGYLPDGSVVDRPHGSSTRTCNKGSWNCLTLHNGAVLHYDDSIKFCDTSATSGMRFYVDPDGVAAGSDEGPGKSVEFWLYYDGALRSRSHLLPGSTTYSGCVVSNPKDSDPPWFSWSN